MKAKKIDGECEMVVEQQMRSVRCRQPAVRKQDGGTHNGMRVCAKHAAMFDKYAKAKKTG